MATSTEQQLQPSMYKALESVIFVYREAAGRSLRKSRIDVCGFEKKITRGNGRGVEIERRGNQ